MSVVDIYPEHIKDDLARSGLEPTDLRVRALGPNEKHATNTPASVEGYVLPYFNFLGKPLAFYRVRLYDYDPKYKQLANSPNHIYFPPGFAALAADPNTKCILLTEGEKKAAAAVKAGFACVGVGGVDSWRNRIISMPKDTTLVQGQNKQVLAKLASGAEATEKTDSLAVGMQDLINILLHRQIPLVIVYDSDTANELRAQKRFIKGDVQKAAALLGYELRFRGVPAKFIRQLILEPTPAYLDDKLGLDDYLTHPKLGHQSLEEALEEVLNAKSAFPRHPNPKEFVNRKLQRSRMPRGDMQALSTAILCDLDSRGSRLRSPDDDTLYYFHNASHQLIPVTFRITDDFAKTPFGVKLYQDYNLSAMDNRILGWLGAQFSGEDPITDVNPEKVLALRGDNLYYQISGGKMLRVNATNITLLDNGSDNILFEAGLVEDLDIDLLMTEIGKIQKGPLPNYWYQTLQESRIAASDDDRHRKVLALLYQISPWFYRWRETQLPVEMMIAEPGSGKSTLYTLRLDVMTGRPILRNAPNDMRDWTASVAATGGLHVTDNVAMGNSGLRQELSDEICRIITEPNPHIERRKLYSDNQLVRTPVKSVFAITAIKQPFTNADIIQRSIITQLDKGDDEVEYEAGWEKRQLSRFGGREGWLAHQLIFQQRLFRLIQEKWDPKYKAKFRLINVEQLLILAAEVLGWDGSWIPDHLATTLAKRQSENDWALDGLKTFAEEWRRSYGPANDRQRFSARTIADWASGHEDFSECSVLTNARSLGNHIKRNKNLISTTCGISEKGTQANVTMYWAHMPSS